MTFIFSIDATQAVAYSRVSTVRQKTHGTGLEGQRVAIDEFASKMGLTIAERFEDALSGAGEGSVKTRPGLMGAIAKAKFLGCPIIIADISRLSRSSEDIMSLVSKSGVTIFSASDGTLVTGAVLASKAKRAEHDRDLISTRTKNALAAKKQAGVALGNRTNLPEARAKGVLGNKARATEMVKQIADILASDPEWPRLKARDVVDLLNRRQFRTSRHEEWSMGSVRRPLDHARKLLEKRELAENEDNPNWGKF